MINGKMYESEYEQAFVELLQNAGWDYTFGENLHRQITDPILEDDLREFLNKQYAHLGFTDDDCNAAIAHIRNIGGDNDYDALRNTYFLYRNGYDYSFMDVDKQPFHLDYIDFDHPENNIFRVVNQFEMKQGNQTRIPDVLLFINGIPVCIIELKNPTDVNATIRNAHTQITVRYRRDISALMKYCPIACISDASNSRMGATTADYEFFYAWKKIENEDQAGSGLQELDSLIHGALKPTRLVEILRDFVYFPNKGPQDSKEICVVCRYPQFFAARRLRGNILAHLQGNGGDGKGGIYFGATGCGKTYTMLFLSRLLAQRCTDKLGSPTILLIVDREDLEEQASDLFCESSKYLEDEAIKVFDSRSELQEEMSTRNSGGVYITTIQKFTSATGLLTERNNVICLSDEAHRTQNNIGSTMTINKDATDGQAKLGAFISYGFAKYLRDALPNATYVGFTGTPTDDAIHVFGGIVDQYTMKQSQEDGITVPIKYDPRLARVFVGEQAKLIEEYYKLCADEGATPADIAKSKAAMSKMNVILADTDRLERVANDIVNDYEARCANKPDVVQKAMIACSTREIAYQLYQIIAKLRPEWVKPVKAMDESVFTEKELKKLNPVRFVNVIATRGKDDPADMYSLLGDNEYRKTMQKEFKNNKSNFHIAIVVDMWITGFDAQALTMLYNDKPLQKHTLIQTISRVNRVYPGKEYGYVIDYIGIRENMKQAMKRYGGDITDGADLDKAHESLQVEIKILQDLTHGLNFNDFFSDKPLARLQFLQAAAEFIMDNSVQEKGKVSLLTRFKGHVKRLKSAYDICNPAGILSDQETGWSQCFMGIMSFLRKITDTTHDVESMNRHVEQMVKEALNCTGIESVLNATETEENIFDEAFLKELDDVKMPNTKFQLLVKMLKRAIKEYSRTNDVRGKEFMEMLNAVVDQYNTRDKLTFTNDVATDTVNSINGVVDSKIDELTDKLIQLFQELESDKEEFKKLGITFEEKAFYDILTSLRDKHQFEYPDEKCKLLAKEIKLLVDGSSLYADFLNNPRIKAQLSSDVVRLLYKNGYPPQWNAEVFDKVIAQVENFKKYQGYTV